MPGAGGYSSNAGGQDFANILFASGPDLCLVGAEWQPGLTRKMSLQELVA